MNRIFLFAFIMIFSAFGKTGYAQHDITDSVAIFDMSSKDQLPYAHHIILTDTNSRKFLGVWQYENGGKIFTIYMNDTTTRSGISIQFIIGWYDYTINGKRIQGLESKNTLTGSTSGSIKTLELTLENDLHPEDDYFLPAYVVSYIDNNTLKFELSSKWREWHQIKNELNLPVGILLRRQQ